MYFEAIYILYRTHIKPFELSLVAVRLHGQFLMIEIFLCVVMSLVHLTRLEKESVYIPYIVYIVYIVCGNIVNTLS